MKYKVILIAEDGEYTVADRMSYDAAVRYIRDNLSNYGEGQELCIESYHV